MSPVSGPKYRQDYGIQPVCRYFPLVQSLSTGRNTDKIAEFGQFVGIFPLFESCQRVRIPTRLRNSISLSVFSPRLSPVSGPEYRQDHGIRPACRCWMFTAGWEKPGTRERVRFSSETRQIGIEREKEGHGGTVKSGRTEKGRISAP